MKKILILCTGNSCRSQMADGLLKHLTSPDKLEVYSAGTHPEKVNPYAVKVMQRYGIDISENKSNNIEEYIDIEFDFVLTVCDSAKELCPIFPSSNAIHKSFPDPANAKGTDEELIEVYSDVCNNLNLFLKEFLKEYIIN